VAWVHSFNDNLSWIKGSHTFKGGLYFEHLYNTEGKGSVGAGPWAGQFNFSAMAPTRSTPATPSRTRSSARSGTNTEIDALPR